MDYWASLEHHLKYKTENDVSDSLKCRLKHDADLLSAIDADLQDIFLSNECLVCSTFRLAV